jgi:hypothetical protein
MNYFVQGLLYGVLALGWLMSFAGGVIVIISLCSFMNWVGSRINPDADEICEDEDEDE